MEERFLLKIYDTDTEVGKQGLKRLPVWLQVLERLGKTGLQDRICRPIRTVEGSLFYVRGRIAGALFSYILGDAVGYGRPYTEEELRQLSALVKELHMIPGEGFADICPSETYELSFCDRLEQLLLRETGQLPEAFRKEAEGERELLLGRVEALRREAEWMKKENLPFVLCHTDIHGGNLIRDPQGKLWLIDWENVMLAPKEADLFSFCEEGYADCFCKNANERALHYYLLRRDLEDVQEFLDSVRAGEYDLLGQEEVLSHVRRIVRHIRGKNKITENKDIY
ncbi:MAG TPA: aminoglycoside phosphotransferase family protein [Candidatus Eisenbergiella merdipullorum]|uniref:Aminoglycoside phosphotransferase family protein n=1 Tax=Candidatus Eisenbergiella merdipullorum TaxID=2838553 RepID=A0A9D2KYZ8_9FIRM|nr:aminoglycoside phosphotransferase family protein [Candidatus Eisenbergiella merdipullorum]